MSDFSTKASIAQANPAQHRWALPAAALVIVLAGALAYHNSLQGPFIFDDINSIAENPTIRSLWPIWPVLSPPGDGLAVQDRPVINLSLAVNYAIGGLDVRGYHIFNLLVHILAALTLFGIIRRTLRLSVLPQYISAAATPLALAAALIWTVHPLATEAVTYIIQRTESMMGLFYLLTLYCVIRGAGGAHTFWWLSAAVVASAMGMGTKEAMVTAPLIVLTYDRVFLARSFKQVFTRRWPLYVALAATWGLLAVMVLPLSGRALHHYGLEYWQATHSYALTQIEAVVRYLGLCFWPYPLVMDYGYLPRGEEVTLSLPHAAVIVLLLAVTIWALCYRPRFGFLGLWFFAILAPSSSIVPLVVQPIAEKRIYLPLAAVVVIVVIGAYALGHRFWQRPGRADRPHRAVGRIVGLTLGGAIVLALGIVTVRRNDDYSSEWSIWNDTVTKLPGNWRAWNNRGVAHGNKGNHDKAISDCTRAIELDPSYATAYNNRGFEYAQKGDYDKAIGDFTRAIQLEPHYAKAYNNRGAARRQMGDYDKAIRDCTMAIELAPQIAQFHNDRGLAYGGKGELDKAISDYIRAIELEPSYAEAYNNRGIAHGSTGDVTKALLDFTRAIKLQPNYPEAYNNRGFALAKKGDYDAAISDYTKAIELDPNYADAHNNRASAYGQKGEFDNAIRDYTRTIELVPSHARAYKNRGIAHGQKGEFDKAIRDYTKTIELDPNYATAYTNRSVAYYHKRDYARARADVTRAQALGQKVDPRFLTDLGKAALPSPRNELLFFDRGFAYVQKGEFDKAIHEFTRLIQLEPDHAKAYNNRGLAYGGKGELDKAISDYIRAIELEPSYAEAYNNRGIAHGSTGDVAKALLDFTRAIELQSSYPEAYNNRGQVWQQVLALNLWRDRDSDQVADGGENINDADQVIDLVGPMLPRKLYDAAISDYTKAIELNPNYADAHNNRASAYGEKGEFDKAIRDYTKTIELVPSHAKAYKNRGIARGQKGEFDKAILDYTKAIELDPNYATAYINRSVAYYHKRDYARARADVTRAQALGQKVDPRFLADLGKALPPPP